MRPITWRRIFWSTSVLLCIVVAVVTPLWSTLQGLGQRVLLPAYTFLVRVLPKTQNDQPLTPDLEQDLSAQLGQVELNRCRLENDGLRALTQLAPLPLFDAVGAEVIGEEVDETGRRLLINRGVADGLVAGLAVVAPVKGALGSSGVLVGLVATTSAHVASVILTTAPQSKLVAEVLNASHTQGLAVGEYNLGVRLRYLVLADEVRVGDSVVTAASSVRVPAGLLVGIVSSLDFHEGDLFRSALVAPPEPVGHTQFLQVLKPKQGSP